MAHLTLLDSLNIEWTTNYTTTTLKWQINNLHVHANILQYLYLHIYSWKVLYPDMSFDLIKVVCRLRKRLVFTIYIKREPSSEQEMIWDNDN